MVDNMEIHNIPLRYYESNKESYEPILNLKVGIQLTLFDNILIENKNEKKKKQPKRQTY